MNLTVLDTQYKENIAEPEDRVKKARHRNTGNLRSHKYVENKISDVNEIKSRKAGFQKLGRSEADMLQLGCGN